MNYNNNNNLSPNFLCLFEHDPVYTVGLREQNYSVDEERRLRALGAEFYRYILIF